MSITVITATRNAERTIGALLASIAAQECPPEQFVLVDGCSEDGTLDVVRAYEPRLRARGIVVNTVVEKDNGIYDALNKGLRIATGEWINVIGGDDYYLPDAFGKVLASARHAPADIIHGDIEVEMYGARSYRARPPGNPASVARGMFLFHPAMFAARALYARVGRFNDYRLSGDYDWVFRAVRAQATFHYLDQALVHHHPGGASSRRRALGLAENDTIRKSMGVSMLERRLHYLREKYASPAKRWLVETFIE